MPRTKILLMLLAGFLPWAHVQAAPILVDGSPTDWLINQNTWVSGLTNVHQTIEDQTGSGAFFLAPGWGGQSYDAEALYALKTDTHLYLALFTGHHPGTPNNPAANSYSAGDFALDFGRNGSFEVGINLATPSDPFAGVSGGVYRNVTWSYGLWDSSGKYAPGNPDPRHPTSIASVGNLALDLLGTADLQVLPTPLTGYGSKKTDSHYFYEIGLDLTLLRDAGWDGSAFDIHWTQNCANDSIMVDPPAVPEPGTLALLPLGLLGLFALRRRRTA